MPEYSPIKITHRKLYDETFELKSMLSNHLNKNTNSIIFEYLGENFNMPAKPRPLLKPDKKHKIKTEIKIAFEVLNYLQAIGKINILTIKDCTELSIKLLKHYKFIDKKHNEYHKLLEYLSNKLNILLYSEFAKNDYDDHCYSLYYPEKFIADYISCYLIINLDKNIVYPAQGDVEDVPNYEYLIGVKFFAEDFAEERIKKLSCCSLVNKCPKYFYSDDSNNESDSDIDQLFNKYHDNNDGSDKKKSIKKTDQTGPIYLSLKQSLALATLNPNWRDNHDAVSSIESHVHFALLEYKRYKEKLLADLNYLAVDPKILLEYANKDNLEEFIL